jgi:hypothetical protein
MQAFSDPANYKDQMNGLKEMVSLCGGLDNNEDRSNNHLKGMIVWYTFDSHSSAHILLLMVSCPRCYSAYICIKLLHFTLHRVNWKSFNWYNLKYISQP